jgi:hypothetical protein
VQLYDDKPQHSTPVPTRSGVAYLNHSFTSAPFILQKATRPIPFDSDPKRILKTRNLNFQKWPKILSPKQKRECLNLEQVASVGTQPPRLRQFAG